MVVVEMFLLLYQKKIVSTTTTTSTMTSFDVALTNGGLIKLLWKMQLLTPKLWV